MTPIESRYDVRLLTLMGVAISSFETLALELDVDADKLLAESLYLTTKRIHEVGEEMYISKLESNYPLLAKAID